MTTRPLPLVSFDVLHSLEDSLGGERTVCRGFVNTYVDMWTGRFQRLSHAIRAGNMDAAMDSALSLCTSSHMVGAKRLEQSTEDLICILRFGSMANASQVLPSLGQCGQETVNELVERYVRSE